MVVILSEVIHAGVKVKSGGVVFLFKLKFCEVEYLMIVAGIFG